MSSISSASATLGAAPTSGSHQANRQHHRQEFTQALSEQGVSSDKAAQIQKQIDDALKSARSSGGSRQQSQAAIESILKQNGFDPAKLRTSIKAQHQSQGGPAETHANDGDGDDQGGQTAQATAQGSIDVTA
ncbi:MAG: hypothetical protein WC718_18350 [Phycisphaerales bacterium]|jgi:hypothetical protein